jgi:D-beta-D-heptose 7-phosphate kinase/D-beta-D-heptose 1-phosphate adenosyltransferase
MRPAVTKICDWTAAETRVAEWKSMGKTVVMTNGTFDLLHAGHTGYLEWAREQGDCLVVGLNTDDSIRRLKGEKRPLVPEPYRASLLAALESVDLVVLFDQDEPRELIEILLPQVLVKAEDWSHYVSGREAVEGHGGEVRLAPMTKGLSTSSLIDRICRVFTGQAPQLDPQPQRSAES